MVEESLGSESVTKEKMLFIAFLIFVFAFLFYGLIGISAIRGTTWNLLLFYIVFGLFGMMFVLLDYFVFRKHLPIDTITIDQQEAPIKLSPKMQIYLSIGLAIAFGWFITTTQSAFVQSPKFQLFETKLGESILSATVGGVLETLFFFVVLAPTLYSVIYQITKNKMFALLGFFVGGTLMFFLFHTVIYEYNIIALQSVIIFGFVNVLLLYLFRSALPLIAIHFANNFVISYFLIAGFFVII